MSPMSRLRPLAVLSLMAGLHLAALPAFAEGTPEPAAPSPAAWTQLSTDGDLVARAVVAGGCPEISIDGVAAPMAVRAAADERFPMTVCEARIPAAAATAAIGDMPLRLLPETLDRIAVIGDTGCRISATQVQACNDPEQFPLAEIAGQIAAWQPDLIIHVGDYIYREAPCPEGNAGCAGSPWGDNGATWDADVFGPMARVLPAAPWVFLRGNHELCNRAGDGWFRHLDPGPVPAACTDFTEPYEIDLDGARFLVMDSASIGDTTTTPEIDAAFTGQLARLEEMTEPGSWLLTHKPIAGAILRLDRAEHYVSYATMRAISDNTLPDGIEVVVSGHVHLAEAVLYEQDLGRPIQLTAGNGGTLLDPGETAAFSGALLENPEVDVALIGASFGWTTLVPDGDRLTATALAVDGGVMFTVHLPNPAAAALAPAATPVGG